MTTITYSRSQFAEAVSYLYVGATGKAKEDLLRLHQNLQESPSAGTTNDLARNATLWANVVEENIRFGHPDHAGRLQELIENFRAHPGL